MIEFVLHASRDGVSLPLVILTFASTAAARRHAFEMIESEGLDAVRLWAGSRDVIEVRRPVLPKPVSPTTSAAHERADRMLSRRADGLTIRAVAEEFGLSRDHVAELLASAARRAEMRQTQPNRAVLSNRAMQAVRYLVEETETDPAERDALLPARVAEFTRREIESVPNIGKGTLAEIEAWLWERGLTLA